MRIGAAYVRVSTDDQLEFSPDSQLHKIKEYAKENDISLPAEYLFREEEGRSGRNAAHRPEFQRMIALAKSTPKPFDVILVWKFSRFARNREDSVVYKSMLRKKCGIDVISVSEPIGDDKTAVLMEAIIEAMDEYYSVNLAEEVKRGMCEKAARGGIVGSPAFGYLAQNGTFVPDPEKAPIVRMVFHKFVAGAGCRDLAAMLNAMGIRSKKGYPMENRTVEYMLRNPVYIGKIRWNPNGKTDRTFDQPAIIVSNGHHEPIVSTKLFLQAQEKFAQRKKMFAKYARQSHSPNDCMLKGLVRCSSCGSTLVRCGKGMQCYSYGRGNCKDSHYISQEQANERVIHLIEQAFEHAQYAVHRVPVPSPSDQFDLIDKQVQREKTKLERIECAYENGIDTLNEYKQKKQQIIKTMEQLKKSRSMVKKSKLYPKNTAYKTNRSLVEDLQNPNISNAKKNLILRSLIDHIIFDRTKNVLQVYCYW